MQTSYTLLNNVRFLSCIFAICVFYDTSLGAINFSEAKKELKSLYFSLNKEFKKDFYCQAPFSVTKKANNITLSIIPSKAYTPQTPLSKSGKKNPKTTIIEWEHIMPASTFGKHLPCWKKGGRKACQKDVFFQKMESDMQNIVPAIGEINHNRKDYIFANAPQDLVYTQYGNCRVYVDRKHKRFYPADYSKGYIARSYLYMVKTYKIPLDSEEYALMRQWDKQYPSTKEEIFLRQIFNTLNQKLDIEFSYKTLRHLIYP